MTNSEQETITVTIQPEAAESLLMALGWGETELPIIRALSRCMRSGEPLQWEVKRDAE